MLENVTKEGIIEFIKTNKIELCSTHAKLCVLVINRIYKKMVAGVKFSEIKVKENVICDGHHRYVASLLANFPLERIPGMTTAATKIVSWEFVYFEEEDWDTVVKIEMLNKKDAEYNNLSIEKITELIK